MARDCVEERDRLLRKDRHTKFIMVVHTRQRGCAIVSTEKIVGAPRQQWCRLGNSKIGTSLPWSECLGLFKIRTLKSSPGVFI